MEDPRLRTSIRVQRCKVVCVSARLGGRGGKRGTTEGSLLLGKGSLEEWECLVKIKWFFFCYATNLCFEYFEYLIFCPSSRSTGKLTHSPVDPCPNQRLAAFASGVFALASLSFNFLMAQRGRDLESRCAIVNFPCWVGHRNVIKIQLCILLAWFESFLNQFTTFWEGMFIHVPPMAMFNVGLSSGKPRQTDLAWCCSDMTVQFWGLKV